MAPYNFLKYPIYRYRVFKMKISNEHRDEKIAKFINGCFEAPLISKKYIKYYEVVVGDDEVEYFTLEDILMIAEEVGPDFKIIVSGAEIDMSKLTKDVRKTTNSIIKSSLKKNKK